MGSEDGNAGAGGAGPTGDAIPELVEVDVEGQKYKVQKGAEGMLMKEKDYRQKTQSLAEEKRSLEKERESLKGEIESARGLMGFLAGDEKANGVVMALLTGDKAQARKLLGDESEGNELETIKNELASLKMQLKSKDARDQDAAKKTQQYADAKRTLKEKYNLDLDEIYPQMAEYGMKNNNPFVPWAVTVALDKIKEQAASEGKKLGTKEALEELRIKLDNTPQISSGAGGNDKGKKKSQIDTVADVFNRLQEDKLRRSVAG
jgi:hypothetical protein